MTRFHTILPGAMVGLIAVQGLCTAFFLWDVIADARAIGAGSFGQPHLMIEAAAAVSLILAVVFEIRYLMALLRRKAHLERQVSIAAGAFHDIVTDQFDRWRLTPAERDVAMFAIKGCSVAETAALRGSAEGTVKAQLAAVYRKAGVAGRGALLSFLVEDLIQPPVPAPAGGPDRAPRAG